MEHVESDYGEYGSERGHDSASDSPVYWDFCHPGYTIIISAANWFKIQKHTPHIHK